MWNFPRMLTQQCPLSKASSNQIPQCPLACCAAVAVPHQGIHSTLFEVLGQRLLLAWSVMSVNLGPHSDTWQELWRLSNHFPLNAPSNCVSAARLQHACVYARTLCMYMYIWTCPCIHCVCTVYTSVCVYIYVHVHTYIGSAYMCNTMV